MALLVESVKTIYLSEDHQNISDYDISEVFQILINYSLYMKSVLIRISNSTNYDQAII